MTIDPEDYVEKFKPSLMDVVYSWCNGSSFAQICKMTDVFEGKYPSYCSFFYPFSFHETFYKLIIATQFNVSMNIVKGGSRF